MRAFWARGRKGALEETDQPTPIDDGRFCRVVDLENGEIPVPTYGRTAEEVLSKIERTGMHARIRLTSVNSPTHRQPPAPGPGAAAPASRRLALTADEQMLETTRLADPQLAPRAITKLFESATGIDTEKLAAEAFTARAIQWQARHPELLDTAFNMKLITDNARMRAGDLRNVTGDVLEQVYQELQAGGYLLTEEHLPASLTPPALPAVRPGESQVPRTRQTDPAFASSHRINRTGSMQAPQWQPKYTREQIDRMPLAESDRLLRTRDKDYSDSVNHWYPPARQAHA